MKWNNLMIIDLQYIHWRNLTSVYINKLYKFIIAEVKYLITYSINVYMMQ